MKRNLGICLVLVATMLILTGSTFASKIEVSGKPFDFGQEFDLGGQTVTFIAHWDLLAWNDAANPISKQIAVSPERIKEAEEKFNCKIRSMVVPAGERESVFMARLLSGESAYDVWDGLGTGIFEGLVGQNAFYPVGDILPPEYFEALPPMHRAMAKAYEFQGKTYGFGAAGNGVVQITLTAYNKSLFEREGLPDPYELYKKGEWTWDTFKELAVQATRDLDGDGVIDQWGLATVPNYDAVGRFAYANEAAFAKFDENGRVVFAFDEPNALDAIRLYQELVDLKVIAPSGDPITQFVSGQAAMDVAFYPWYMTGPYQDNMEDEYGLVPTPIGPAATNYNFIPREGQTMVLPANSEQPLALIALVDFLWPSERLTSDVFEYVFSNMSPNRETFEMLMIGHSQLDGKYYLAWPHVAFNGVEDAINQIVNEGKAPAAAMEEVKPRIQAVLDELFRQ